MRYGIKRTDLLLALLAVVILFAGALFATPSSAAESAPGSGPAEEALFKGMKWRLIGPFRGGRVLAVTGVSGQPDVYYFGGVSGGVWKTIDGGQNWTPLTDKENFASIGAIAVAPSDPNVIYVGTGEGCPRGNISHGDGVYKSLDGGKTWKNVGLKDTQTIPRLIVHPTNPNIVFVAALGHVYGPNAERGVFRSTDGGDTWEKVLYKDDKTGAVDITFDPTNPHTLFAALWEVNRTPYSLTSGGPGSGLYKSTDDGKTWKRLEGNGLPKGVLGRIGVAVSSADGSRVYALIEAEQGGLYRSDDGGDHWSKINGDHRFRQRAWYFTHIFADPKSADTVYVLNTGTYRSTDGGHTFKSIPAPHGDDHGLWIDPANPQRMIEGHDGGATISTDGGKTWSTEYNQPTAQFYHVIADNRFPYYVYGAQQDNSTVAIASAGEDGVIDRSDWYAVGGGESGWIAPDPSNPDVTYANSYEGNLSRYNHRTWEEEDITPWPENIMGYGADSVKYRFQWTTPLLVSRRDPHVLYTAAQVLFKSTDDGASWQVISPDLTRNDKSKQQPSGGPITKDNTSIEYYDTIFAVAESPVQRDLIWTGSDDGLVHLTRDGGRNWADVTPKAMPAWSMISLIEASHHDAGAAYIAVDRHRLDDLRPFIYKTADYGKTWTEIVAGIPADDYVHAVREDPKKPGLLYAGTESGPYVSFDDGGHWQPLRLNLADVPVHDLAVQDDDLIIATHGRSFWILDDVSPLRQLDAGMASEPAHLYTPRLAYRSQIGGGVAPHGAAGQNPPHGAIINYYLKAAPKEKEEVTLEILDSKGKVVRKFSNLEKHEEEQPSESFFCREPTKLPVKAGMNRFAWDLSYEAPPKVAGSGHWGGLNHGPTVLPGKYEVRLTAAGKTLSAPLEVKLDPRVKTAQADLEKQFDLATRITDDYKRDHDTVNQIRSVRSELGNLKKRLADDPKAKGIIAASDALDKKMTPVEEALIQTKSKSSEDALNFPVMLDDKLGALGGSVESADAAPTAQDEEVFKELDGELSTQLGKWNDIRREDLAALNEMVRKANIPTIMAGPPQAAGGR